MKIMYFLSLRGGVSDAAIQLSFLVMPVYTGIQRAAFAAQTKTLDSRSKVYLRESGDGNDSITGLLRSRRSLAMTIVRDT